MNYTVQDAWEFFLSTKDLKSSTRQIDIYRWNAHLKHFWGDKD